MKYVEAYPGQILQDGSKSAFGPSMTAQERKQVKEFLHKKGIKLTSFGVVVAKTKKEWLEMLVFSFQKAQNAYGINNNPKQAGCHPNFTHPCLGYQVVAGDFTPMIVS